MGYREEPFDTASERGNYLGNVIFDDDEGSSEDGPVHALTRLGTPLLAQIGPVARSAGLAAIDAMFPFGRMGAIRTRTLSGISGPIIDALQQGAHAFTSPFSGVLLHQFHGAATRVPLNSTAFGRREPHLMAELISVWERDDDPQPDRHLRWAEQLHAALEPHSLPGGYVNFLGMSEQITHCYGSNAARLLAVKSSVDPQSVSHRSDPLPDRRGPRLRSRRAAASSPAPVVVSGDADSDVRHWRIPDSRRLVSHGMSWSPPAPHALC